MKKMLLSLALMSSLGMTAMAADLTIAYDADPVSMDPMEQIAESSLQMAAIVYDPLVRFDDKLQIEPRLAEKWEEINPTTMRFYLRKGVKFHSGNEMTADDVIFSFDRFKKSIDYKGLFEPYEAMVKVDDYTVDLKMKEPYPLVLPNMTYLSVMDQKFFTGKDDKGRDKDLIDKTTGTFASLNVSGTGPFVLESRQQGVKSVYKKFDQYWGDRGNVDTLTLVPIKENATRVSALLSGDVDWIYPVPPTDLERVQKAKGITSYSVPSDRIITIQMNQSVVPEFKDKKVREAVIYAVNKSGITDKIMRGSATPAEQNSPEVYTGHNPNLAARFDLDKAKNLMKEAGLENGFTVTMISPNNRYINDEKVAQAVAAMLARINIKVNLTTMPVSQYWTEFDKCASGLQLIGWSSDTGDSANYSEYLTMTKDSATGIGQFNCSGYSNLELDQLVQAANLETNQEKRTEMLQKVSQIEYDDAVFIPLYWSNQTWAYSDKLKNFKEIINFKNFPLWGDLVIEE